MFFPINAALGPDHIWQEFV